MAETKLGDATVHTNGELPIIGSSAPDFLLTTKELKDVTLADYAGKNIVLNIFPSIDTSVCATSVREFNVRVASLENTVVLCVSADLPFALGRFCGSEGIENAIPVSTFRSTSFIENYGVQLVDGALYGLLARAVIVIDSEGIVQHTELVESISNEPNYDSALAVLI